MDENKINNTTYFKYNHGYFYTNMTKSKREFDVTYVEFIDVYDIENNLHVFRSEVFENLKDREDFEILTKEVWYWEQIR